MLRTVARQPGTTDWQFPNHIYIYITVSSFTVLTVLVEEKKNKKKVNNNYMFMHARATVETID